MLNIAAIIAYSTAQSNTMNDFVVVHAVVVVVVKYFMVQE
jgi:hypothetical protein